MAYVDMYYHTGQCRFRTYTSSQRLVLINTGYRKPQYREYSDGTDSQRILQVFLTNKKDAMNE